MQHSAAFKCFLICLFFICTDLPAKVGKRTKRGVLKSMNFNGEKKVFKKVLKNGLTVLVYPNHNIPKVTAQIWYGVGSKDEKSGEKGLAHFIEHMSFKGTEKLSEPDLQAIAHKLSGSTNAFTSNDCTGYIYEFPKNNWKEALPLFADVMKNCSFKTGND